MYRELMRKNEITVDDEDTSLFMYVLSSIYMYLFVVVLAMVMAIHSMVINWEKDITGSITVQVLPVEDENKKIDTDNKLVHLTVSMFGRETPVELQLGQIEPIM